MPDVTHTGSAAESEDAVRFITRVQTDHGQQLADPKRTAVRSTLAATAPLTIRLVRLGMRLLKRSVNQDDVSAYHLVYADAKGSPGSDLTLFDCSVPPEWRGSRSITRTALRANGDESLAWWAMHLAASKVNASPIIERDGRQLIDCEDFDGQRLTLVNDGGGAACRGAA